MQKPALYTSVKIIQRKIAGLVNHQFVNTRDERKAASVVEHKDGTLNVVDRNWQEHYNGKNKMSAFDAVIKILEIDEDLSDDLV